MLWERGNLERDVCIVVNNEFLLFAFCTDAFNFNLSGDTLVDSNFRNSDLSKIEINNIGNV